ncbi:unnamed protein product (macronuclear) [Paramecium tetraurelia]|uniref:CHCH domain-containing protein n=1 Tax=Paramecium tetraurelia TaxID=5888 RepID=A0C3Z9_PARTE|nr:uncharacterized protein GSPATT00034996001 [Paramecium tetraurelia]CAK65516.1 unnamed protein product [Paramecium tetraurelia]|eukprot:XP_001432913.1 hypothetical protein (macronuclear) [Paramecium tetraurelia strain d4-2]
MSFNGNALLTPSRYGGESWNAQTCFTAQEDYFECLDRENSTNVNRKLCGREHQLWKEACPDSDRRAQMIFRRLERQNQALYTSEQLRQYNNHQNNRSFK